jgi:hypothetical protein
LPGIIDLDRLEKSTVDIVLCTVWRVEKAEWIDRARKAAVFVGREVVEG